MSKCRNRDRRMKIRHQPSRLSLRPRDHDQNDEEGFVDAHGGPNGVNGHAIEEEDYRMDLDPFHCHPPHLRREVPRGGRTPMPTSPTPTWLLRPEDQPHPAKRARKHSDADAASVMAVRGSWPLARFVVRTVLILLSSTRRLPLPLPLPSRP